MASMRRNRELMTLRYRGHGRAVISLAWTYSYHPYSHKLNGVKAAYDLVHGCWSRYQAVVTAAIANPPSYLSEIVTVSL